MDINNRNQGNCVCVACPVNIRNVVSQCCTDISILMPLANSYLLHAYALATPCGRAQSAYGRSPVLLAHRSAVGQTEAIANCCVRFLSLTTHMKHFCPLTYLIRHISLNAVLKAYSTAFDLLGNAACQMR